MRRKVIQIAQSTQLISLPRKWAMKHGIKKGDELELDERGNRLIVSSDQGAQLSDITVDVTGLDRTSLVLYLQMLYRLGYDEIKVKFSNKQCDYYRLNKKVQVTSIIHYIASRLIGMEIIQQRDDFAVLKNLEIVSAREFEVVLRRVFLILKDASEDFVKSVKSNDYLNLETVEEKHDSVSKFVSYGMRIINKVGPGGEQNPYLLYHILNQADKLIDIYKYAARDIVKKKLKLSQECIGIISGIHENVVGYCDTFFKYDQQKIALLYKNRDKLLKTVQVKAKKLSPDEILIVEYMRHVLEFLVDMGDARTGLEH